MAVLVVGAGGTLTEGCWEAKSRGGSNHKDVHFGGGKSGTPQENGREHPRQMSSNRAGGTAKKLRRESLVNCSYQEGCLKAAPTPLRDIEAWGRVPALSRDPVRGCPSGVLASETHRSAAKSGADFPALRQAAPPPRRPSLEEDSVNRLLLRSSFHPLARVPGESLEGSSLAGKQEMPLPLPHRQPEQGAFPRGGKTVSLPLRPH